MVDMMSGGPDDAIDGTDLVFQDQDVDNERDRVVTRIARIQERARVQPT